MLHGRGPIYFKRHVLAGFLAICFLSQSTWAIAGMNDCTFLLDLKRTAIRELRTYDWNTKVTALTGTGYKLQEALWLLLRNGQNQEAQKLENHIKTLLETRPILGETKHSFDGEGGPKATYDLGDGIVGAFKYSELLEYNPKKGRWETQHPNDLYQTEDLLIDQTPFKEIAAYEFSKITGVDFVPVTILRRVGPKLGSMQIYVHGEHPWERAWNFVFEKHGSHLSEEDKMVRSIFAFIIDHGDPDSLTVSLDSRAEGADNNYRAEIDYEQAFEASPIDEVLRYHPFEISRHLMGGNFLKNISRLDLKMVETRMRRYLSPSAVSALIARIEYVRTRIGSTWHHCCNN